MSASKEIILTIDGENVDYVRKDLIKEQVRIGEKRIIVADRGWVFVGDCEDNQDGSRTIPNARNIRRWGPLQDWASLRIGQQAKQKHDAAGTVRCTAIVTFTAAGAVMLQPILTDPTATATATAMQRLRLRRLRRGNGYGHKIITATRTATVTATAMAAADRAR